MVHKLAPRLGSEEHVADTVTTPARANGTQSLLASSRQRFFQSTIDALPAHIAILSERGQIVAVNRAWREDSERHYAPMVRGGVGDWYLEQCEDDVTAGIQAVLSGAQEEYAIEYRDNDLDGRHWFSLRAAPLDDSDTRCVLVTHEDVTRRVEAEHARSEADQALDMLAQAAPLAIIALDIDNRITAWNPAAEEMFGWTRAEALGRFNPIVPETDVPQFLDIVASFADDATNLTDVELHRQRKDGVVLDVSSSIAPLRTVDGQIRGSMAVLTDITARKRARENQRFLAEASELLSSSIDYKTTLTQVVQMAVPRLADCCMVHLLESDSSIRRLAVAHADPERQELAQQLKDHGRLQMNGAWGVPVVLRTGEPVIYGDINSRLWDTDNEQIEHIDILRNLGMSSLMVVPLIAREQTIGTLAFVASESGRVYTGSDLDLAMELARRAATAIDNALLHHDVRQSEMWLRTLVEHVPAASYTAEADDLRVMMYVSPQMGLQDDFSVDDLIADPGLWLHMLHPDDRQRVEAVMLACSASGEPLKVEYRIVSADGQVKWQYDQATLIRDEAGQPLHWQGVCIDITDRKRTEETLRIRARQQAAVAQLGQQAMGDIDLQAFMDDAMHVVRETLEVEYVSCVRHDPRDNTVSVAAASGWTPECLGQVGIPLDPQSVTSYTLQSGGPVVVCDMADETRFVGSQVMADHGAVSGLSVIVPGVPDPYGVLQVGSTRPRPFSDDDTHFLQAIGNLLAAASERHQDEEEIRFHAHLLNVVNQAVIATDLDGRISYWNRFAEELYGWSQADVLGKNIADITPSEMSMEQSAEIMGRLSHGESWTGEIMLKRRDDSSFPALVSDSPVFDSQGQLIGIVGVSTDIGDWKQAEAEREGLLRDLGERVKELTVLHQAAALFQGDNYSVPQILDHLAAMLPQGMQFPDMAVARVSLGALEATSPDYQQFLCSIQAGLSTADGVSGTIEVGYREQCWQADEPFLPEESSLIGTIADMLGSYLRRLDTQAQLRRSEKSFRAAAEGGLDAFFILEAVRSTEGEIVDYLIVDTNARGVEFTQLPREQLLNHSIKQLWNPPTLMQFFETFDCVSSTGETVERELQMETSANVNWLQCQVVPLADGVAVSVRDISDRKELEERLTHQAFHDALTGLPNRALFLDRVQHARGRVRRRHEGIAVLFLDLDNFKIVNDSLGHTVGDQLLVAVAERLSERLGEGDSAARLGGDEFAILLEDLADWAVATETAERIVDAFREPFRLAGREIFILPSIGVAIGTCMDTTAEDLLRDADAAMYRAKSNGKARFEVFDPSLTAHALRRFELENDLRGAVERDELRLHYQPLVDLASGETAAFEALVRWQHPVHGLILPLDFIPIAEDTGLIAPIGRWVLEEACQQVSAWNRQRQGLRPLELGVNLSRRQFHDPDLSAQVEAAIHASGLSPHLLNLEITESVMIEDEGMASEALARLKALGVQLVIDDFGTGYSSLGMLRSFPVDVLKIDRGFVMGLESNVDDRVIISGIIDLAHALHLLVVAEGVETQEQLHHLTELGCDYAQGYYIGKPLPAQPGGPPTWIHPKPMA